MIFLQKLSIRMIRTILLTVILAGVLPWASSVPPSCPPEADRFTVSIKGKEGNVLRYYGDALLVNVSQPTAGKYVFRITPKESPGCILFQKTVTAPGSGDIEREWSVTFASYKGEVAVRGYAVQEEGEESEESLGVVYFTVQ